MPKAELKESYLTTEEIRAFQVLVKKHYGQSIPDEIALEQGMRLIRAYEAYLKLKNQCVQKEK